MMTGDKKYVLSQLKEHILFLQGMKKPADTYYNVNLGDINNSFPHNLFPVAAVHEFINDRVENIAVTKGFVSYVIGQLMQGTGISIWISSSQNVFPPSLKHFSIDPDKIVFIRVHKESELLWVMEEALKCEGIRAVVCDVSFLDMTSSRRFQLAVEKSGVTGFIVRSSAKENINACVARWKITSLASDPFSKLPGVGFPRWNIELLRIRNGKPGEWQMEFMNGNLYPVRHEYIVQTEERKVV